MFDIAESIDDVRGMPRTMAARCSGTDAMGGVAFDGCLPLNLPAKAGSDALLEVAFDALEAGSDGRLKRS